MGVTFYVNLLPLPVGYLGPAGPELQESPGFSIPVSVPSNRHQHYPYVASPLKLHLTTNLTRD